VALDDAYGAPEDTALVIGAPGVLANDNDVDGDPLTAVLETGPSHGTLTLNANGSFSYTPNANFNGTDLFTYHASDGTTSSNVATVMITVTPVNDAPVAVNDMAITPEDTAVAIDVLANDTDADNVGLTVTGVTQGTHGTVAINADGTVLYTPAANWFGTDTFSYTASDGALTASATVTVTVAPVNDAPVANDDVATTSKGVPIVVDVRANDMDVDGDALNVVSVAPPGNGSAAINSDGTVTYTPNADFSGTDTFAYTISDGNGGTQTATVRVTVKPAGGVQLTIDIYPNRTPNLVYLSRNYTLYVVVFGSVGFNVSDLDWTTVRFGRTGTEARAVRAPVLRDMNGDGILDALYGFMTFDCGFVLGDTKGILSGKLKDGTDASGEDSVVVIP
jgi:VCBS repeat-containing protein